MLTGNNPPPPHNHGVPSSPKLLGGLTGNTDATGSPKHPYSVNPHRAAAQPPTRAAHAAQFSSSTARRSRPHSCSRIMNLQQAA